jgi:hypothetical protein
MKVHANAALGPAGRLALVRDVEAGMTAKVTLSVSLKQNVSSPPR